MAGTTRKTGRRMYEVLVSFSGLNVGDRFGQDADDLAWAKLHAESGYLRDVTEEPTAEVAQNAGEVGIG